jgi:Flp pilus assembly protein TadD
MTLPRTLLFAAALAVALTFFTPIMSAISPDAAELQIQLGKLLFTDGRYLEAFNAFELAKPNEDPRIRREALRGAVKSALRLGDFSHAYADAQLLAKTSARDSESIALYADALWAAGLFEQSEQKYQDALSVEGNNGRALHGLARSLAARNKLNEALDTAQAALSKDPRDAEFHHTVGSVY